LIGPYIERTNTSSIKSKLRALTNKKYSEKYISISKYYTDCRQGGIPLRLNDFRISELFSLLRRINLYIKLIHQDIDDKILFMKNNSGYIMLVIASGTFSIWWEKDFFAR